MEAVEGRGERVHGLGRLDVDRGEAVAQLLEVVELGGRHLRQLRLVGHGGRQLGVLGEPLEGGQLTVGERAEQVDDGGPVLGLRGGGLPVLGGDARGRLGCGCVGRLHQSPSERPPAWAGCGNALSPVGWSVTAAARCGLDRTIAR